MIPYFSKRAVLEALVSILKANTAVTSLVPKRNISAGLSEFNSMSAAIDVVDGGDEIRSEIQWRTTVLVIIKTKLANINASDMLCCDIADAVNNCIAGNQNLLYNSETAVSRLLESSSEPVQETEDPNIRSHTLTFKFAIL